MSLLLNPVLVVGGVGVSKLLVDEAGQVDELVNEFKQPTHIVGDGGDQVPRPPDGGNVWIGPPQVLFINIANTLHALVGGLVVTCSLA